jgi:hypothetical protein
MRDGPWRLALTASLRMIQSAEQNKLVEALDNNKTYLDYQDDYPATTKACRGLGLPPPLPIAMTCTSTIALTN